MKYIIFIIILVAQTINSALAYDLKVVVVSGYSKPWVVISADQVNPKNIKSARIHFHGWTQSPKSGLAFNPKYDFDWIVAEKIPNEAQIKKFVESYSIQREVEVDSSRVVLIPLSRGHCDQYEELEDISKFDSIIKKLFTEIGLNANPFLIRHMSAHSGGGKTLSRLLKNADHSLVLSKVSQAYLYDAIYHQDTVNELKTWVLNHHEGNLKQLKLFSIAGQSPEKFGKGLFKSIETGEVTQVLSVDGIKLNVKNKITKNTDRVILIQESNETKRLNHWSLVSSLWLF
jgi:hypothetical protein